MSKINWARYKKVINSFHKEAFQDTIIWQRAVHTISPHGEDTEMTYINVGLKGLVQFNTFRTWPITKYTETGEEDKQSEVLWLNLAYLQEAGLTDASGRFNYKLTDRFVHRGQFYEAAGDTLAAQAKDEPLLFMIVLKRLNVSEPIPVLDDSEIVSNQFPLQLPFTL